NPVQRLQGPRLSQHRAGPRGKQHIGHEHDDQHHEGGGPQDIAARKSTNIGLSFLSGLLVTLGNPKTMLFYVALVPTLIDIGNIGLRDYALLLTT
ncbi:LysE family translocator, partial [Rhizobium leguminosarum]|uniref:LysE family translocator n=1 Tax=Rhizobium leguminosarum TaxID=384 RepID=UPI003F965848